MSTFKNIVTEFKTNIFFYSIISWFVLWILLMINERYNVVKPFNKKDNDKDLYFHANDIFFQKIEEHVSKHKNLKQIEDKMNYFKYKPKFLHNDIDLIEFFWSLKEFDTYSSVLFNSMIRTTDIFMKIVYEDYVMTHLVIKNMKDLKREILNTLQQFIFNIPHHMQDKLYDADKVLKGILNKHINRVITLNNKQFEKGNNQHSLNKYLLTNDTEPYTHKGYKMTNMLMY